MNLNIKDISTVEDSVQSNGDYKAHGHVQKTRVIIHEVLPSGRKIFRELGENKVIISGSEYHARKDFNFGTGTCYTVGNKDSSGFYNKLPNIPTYDDELDAKYTSTFPAGATVYTGGQMSAEEARKIYLFGVGIDGCGIEASRRFVVAKNDWIKPYGPAPDALTPEGTEVSTCLIPFRCVDTETPKSPAAMVNSHYHGAYQDTENGKTLYFFKEFDNAPVIDCTAGGVPISAITGGSIWKYKTSGAIECTVKLTLSVTAEDVKEWFALHGEESTSKINTISLISAVPYLDSSDNLWYKDYRPVTKYNMTNKPLSDPNSGLEITYILYY